LEPFFNEYFFKNYLLRIRKTIYAGQLNNNVKNNQPVFFQPDTLDDRITETIGKSKINKRKVVKKKK